MSASCLAVRLTKGWSWRRLASPVFHVTEGDPPLLIFHGDKDARVLIGQSERMVDVYRKRSCPSHSMCWRTPVTVGDEFHTGENRTRVVEFLDQHLKPKK